MNFSKTICGSPAVETVDKAGGKQVRKIRVNEIYGPTIQGEGKTAGKEVKFLRTSGCNLACIWCDTPYTWNWTNTKFAHPDKFDPKKEIHEMTPDEVKAQIDILGKDIRALVISGGEPLIQQKKLLPLLKMLKADAYWIEIETNGTLVPSKEFSNLIDQFNVSLKLSNSGPDNTEKKRERSNAILTFAKQEKAIFKFVISSQQDVDEVLTLVKKYNLHNIYLMPLGKTKEEQLKNQGLVKRLCAENEFFFSPRLHILKYGDVRGV